MKRFFFFLVLFFFLLSTLHAASPPRFRPSVEVFLSHHTDLVKGKRVGLVTNQTGIDSQGRSTIERFQKDPRINLVALFAPEHGIRGTVKAGETFHNTVDPVSKLPVYSLYGDKKQPAQKDLAKIDILVYQLQDIGCKTYTYIWHMAECMAACAKAGIPLIILDVPNPLASIRPDGPIRLPKYQSFIGLYPTPYIYALTVGELARYLKKEENLNCKLYVVTMQGYRRTMPYFATGLPWKQLSPNIPKIESAYGYTVTGPIGMMGIVNTGLEHPFPFRVVAAPWINGIEMAATLNRMKLAGITFKPISYQCVFGRYKGEKISGVELVVTNPSQFRPVEVIVAILCYFRDEIPNFKWNRTAANYQTGFDQALGTDKIRRQIESGESFQRIVASYQADLRRFEEKTAPYKIYK